MPIMTLCSELPSQEVKDTLSRHKREGAREKYAIGQATIIDAYNKAFHFLSVNHGTQARKDVEELNQKLRCITIAGEIRG